MDKCYNICSYEYSPKVGRFDEYAYMQNSRSFAREFWRRLAPFSAEEFARRLNRLNSVLNENDLVSFARGQQKNEGTDPLPILITSEEWTQLKKGIAQRTRLFNALAADIYGEQSLWKKGILPPCLLYANPDFLQVAWQVKPPQNIYVHLTSCDIIRDSNGKFLVAGDQLQVPEGIGRALENRLAVSRAFPELYRDLRVERLAGFFKKMQDCLEDIRPEGDIDKRSVLLASGPESYRRSEDAILARYLGLALVENDDLSVREHQVHLKTLVGLKRIGTIFRRVDDSMCDPLELRIDSGEGAVGLISSVRAGNVAMFNSLGTGVLESPLFKPFMATICRELLGEEQIIPDVPTRWLNNESQADEILEEPEKWKFRHIFRDPIAKSYSAMTVTGQLALLNSIEKDQENWVAEMDIEQSMAPVWMKDHWQATDVAMRFFALNTPNGCEVMSGGFGTFSISGSLGEVPRAGEKDIWVLSEQPVANFSLLAPVGQAIQPSRAGGDLPSRAAENLYLLGRAMESAEMMVRVVRGIATRLADQAWNEMPELPWLLQAGSVATFRQISDDPEHALRTFVLKKESRNGLQHVLAEIRELAIELRDRISEDTWVYLCNFGEIDKPDGTGAAALLPYMKRLLGDSAAFAGLAAESMTRGHGWRFQELGRRIERVVRTLNMLKHTLVQECAEENTTTQLLQALLEIGDCSMTYHRRYGGRIQVAPVIDLFLCDETNPRSVAYQLSRLRYEAKNLPNSSLDETMLSPLDRELLRLLTDLRLIDVQELAVAVGGVRSNLEKCLFVNFAAMERVADLLNRLYLNHAPSSTFLRAMATEV